MQELVVGVLSSGSGRSPQHGGRVARQRLPGGRDALTVTLHRELLQEVRQVLQRLRIGQHGVRVGIEVARLPKLQ